MSFFKEAVPSLTNSLGHPVICGDVVSGMGGIGRLNLNSLFRQPAITRLGRNITST